MGLPTRAHHYGIGRALCPKCAKKEIRNAFPELTAPCPECGGKGDKVISKEPNGFGNVDVTIRPCPRCKGKGEIVGKDIQGMYSVPCPRCGAAKEDD